MGFFDKLFGGKAASETKFSGQKMTVMLPIDGKVIPLEQLPDETFASAILGPGCGVEPTGDTVYAPFDGTVTQVPESLHAVGMMSDDGIELLIHVGMDTVEMKGQGFTSLTKEGAKVKAGTPLLKVDLEAIRAAGHPTATALIVTNSDDLPEISVVANGDAAAGTPVFKLHAQVSRSPGGRVLSGDFCGEKSYLFAKNAVFCVIFSCIAGGVVLE